MSRRSSSDENDSLDLLLDTVSNVFGGVMFLTLLAALLIMTRGTETVIEPEIDMPVINPETEARLIAIEMRQAASVIDAQQKMLARLDPNGEIAEKADRLEALRQTINVARRQVRRTGSAVEDRQQELEDQQAKQSDLEQQIEELREAVAEKSKDVNKIRAESERTVLFRPLSRTSSGEAVVLLRYGRWYLLYEGQHGRLNRDDFFVLESGGEYDSVTPKPHRGHRVSPQSLDELVKHLKLKFPARQFHITVAVWDDSFADFNPLKDALTAGGYRYRTLTCDNTSTLSNQAAVDPFVQ